MIYFAILNRLISLINSKELWSRDALVRVSFNLFNNFEGI